MSKSPQPDSEKSIQDYLDLIMCVFSDVEAITGLDLSRDKLEVGRRSASEGMPFLTKVLPRFHKHLLVAVECGMWTPIAGFQTRRKGPLPKFLSGLVDMLFTPEGQLRDDADGWAQMYIDQITGLYYKTRFGYPDSVIRAKCKEYVELDARVPDATSLKDLDDVTCKVIDNAMEFLRDVLEGFSITEPPRHGPGAVAGGEKSVDKFDFAIPQDLASVFNPACFFGVKHVSEQRIWNTGIYICEDDLALLPARVVFVDKDSRGPRTISCEPKELQWLQQAVGRSLMVHLEAHPLTSGQINFSDQTINGALAVESSRSREYATLDLKDASDSLALALVELLLSRTPIFRMLNAIRSTHSLLPDGTTVRLRKFAPMGSATTFPVESLVFYSLAVGTVAQITGADFPDVCRKVYVYGDDIIVPATFAGRVIETLENCGLRVNKDKSFITGPFRESCGRNAFNGVVTTPVRLRSQLFPVTGERAHDISSIVSLVETSNLLYEIGFWQSASWIADHVENRTFVRLSCVPRGSGCLGLITHCRSYHPLRRSESMAESESLRRSGGFEEEWRAIGRRNDQMLRWSRDFQAPYLRVNRVKAKKEADKGTEHGYVEHLVSLSFTKKVNEGSSAPKVRGCDPAVDPAKEKFVRRKVRRRCPVKTGARLDLLLSTLATSAKGIGSEVPTGSHVDHRATKPLSALGIDLSRVDRLQMRSGRAILS